MSIKIEKTEEKPLLARKEIAASIMFEGKATPSNDEVRKQIASGLKVDEKVVVVKHIYTSFGSSEAKVEAYVYNTEEDLKKIEPKVKEAKKKAAEGAAPAEEAAPAPAKEKKEAPAEKKEETPAEAKSESKDSDNAKPEASQKKEEKAE